MTDQPMPQPRRDEYNVPWCAFSHCGHFRPSERGATCWITGESINPLCVPAARADAAEMAALRGKYEAEVVRERRKANEWSARIVEATEKGLALIAERDAAQVEVARLKVELAAWDRAAREIECREVDAVKRGVVYVLRARVTALTGTTGDAPEKLFREVERLRLIEARAREAERIDSFTTPFSANQGWNLRNSEAFAAMRRIAGWILTGTPDDAWVRR